MTAHQGFYRAYLVLLYTHMQMHAEQFLEKYSSHFIRKGCMWEGVRDRTELQHIDPHSIGLNRVSFPFSWAAQPGTWAPASLWHVPQSSIFSPTGVISKLSLGGPEAPSAGCWHSLPHLVSNWSGLQTDWISCAWVI